MRKVVLILSFFFIIVFFYQSISEKEKIKNHGKTVFLELLFEDHQSFIRENHIRLSYKIVRENIQNKTHQNKLIVLRLDKNQVGQLSRFYEGVDLSKNECLFFYEKNLNYWGIYPDVFYFEKGKSEYYSKARYAFFKVNERGVHILMGLADQNFHML